MGHSQMAKQKSGPLSREILRLIPRDGWVSSSEIANKLGVDSRRIGMIIRVRLLYKYVDRKLDRGNGQYRYLYRQRFVPLTT